MSALVNQIQVSNAVVSSNVWGVLESPMPLNPGQGSDSPGTITATRSTSVRGQRVHVPGPGIRSSMSDTFDS